MTIQDLGSIGELVAAIATVATLVYLAAQIRQNTRSVRTAAFHGGVDSINQLNNLIAGNPTLARIFRVGNETPEELTEDERVQYSFMYLSCFRVFEIMYFHHLQGTGKELWGTTTLHIATLLSTPGARQWWSENTFGFTPEFRNYVEKHLGESN